MRWERPYVGFRPVSPLLLPSRFQIDGLLGRGVGTVVYSAFDEVLERPVAVKLFPMDPDPMTCRRVADEALALDRFDHRHLVSVLDGGIHRNRPYLVMQLIRGESLSERLIAGPLLPALAVGLTALMADGLCHVHSHGVVHRDVKPSNILLDEDGMPYLGDFGIALLPEAARMTSDDEIVGTPAYLAPEQVYGGELGPAVDIYALGLVLLECITGRREYDGTSKMKAALARLDRPPQIPANLPIQLIRLLRAMTDADPGRRPTAEQCVDLMRDMMHDMLSTWTAEDEAESAPEPEPSPRPEADDVPEAYTLPTVRPPAPSAILAPFPRRLFHESRM